MAGKTDFNLIKDFALFYAEISMLYTDLEKNVEIVDTNSDIYAFYSSIDYAPSDIKDILKFKIENLQCGL